MTHGVRESERLDKDIQAYKKWLERTRECDRDWYVKYIEFESFYAWENRVTEKQRNFINVIESQLTGFVFTGSTKQEAQSFISDHSWRLSPLTPTTRQHVYTSMGNTTPCR